MTPQAAAAKVANMQAKSPAAADTSARSRWLHALTRIALVIAIVGMSAAIPTVTGTGAQASALGFSCKEPPTPEMPIDPTPAFFDSRSKGDGHDKPPPGFEARPSGYESYGWAGLSWSTYDLGCGEDVIPAGEASRDTLMGNFLLGTGKLVMSIAFWLDDQAKTPEEARATGVTTNGLAKIDALITKIVKQIGDKGVLSQFLALAVMLGACMAGYAALRADTAKIMQTLLLCGAAFGMASFFVGVPQTAINTSDKIFTSVVSSVQGDILDAGGDGRKATPRNVLMDKVLIPEWERGWFGSSYADNPERREKEKLGSTLRDAVAISYEDQAKIQNNPDEGKAIIEAKKKKWENDVVKPLESKGLSYYTLQGKDGNRTSVGAMAAFKTITPSTTWIAGSLLKLLALIVVRFAILLAPIWIPIVIVRHDLLIRATRVVGGAYAWGFIGAALTAVYLNVMVAAYDTTDSSDVDGSWRVWLMLLLAVVCWMFLRPFKRIREIASPKGAASRGLLSRVNPYRRPRVRITDRNRDDDSEDKKSFAAKATEAAGWLLGGPAQAAAEGAASGAVNSGHQRPEGQLIERMRHQRANDAQVAAEMASSRRISEDDDDYGRHRRGDVVDGEVISSTIASSEPDERSAWVMPAGHGRGAAAAALRSQDSEVPTQWDGGPSSPIAPVTLYRPSAAPALAAPTPTALPSAQAQSAHTTVEHTHNLEVGRIGGGSSTPAAPARPARTIWDNDELGDE